MNWASWKLPLIETAKVVLCALLAGFLLWQLADGKQSSTPFAEIQQAVLDAAPLDGMQKADNRMLKRLYGLDPAGLEGCLLYYPSTNMGAEELLLIQLSDPSQQDSVRAAVEARLATQKNSFDGYGVEQMDLLEHCVLEVRGNYILFAVGARASEIHAAFLDAL